MRLHAAFTAVNMVVTCSLLSTHFCSAHPFAWQQEETVTETVPILKPADLETDLALKTQEATQSLDERAVEENVIEPQTNETKPELDGDVTDDAVTEPKLNSRERDRKNALNRCLAIYYTRQVDAEVLRPWSIMHGLIGYGEETLIIYRGRRHSATEYLCANGIGDDRRILFAEDGKLKARMGIGVQGHEAQLLAMLAQANVPFDQTLTVDGQAFEVKDLIQTEMETCRSDSELTFKLLGLSHYLQSDKEWESEQGETWSLERLVKEELEQPVNDGACGGTHRLMAISYALKQRRAEGKPIDGHWYRADKFIRDFQNYAWKFQHREGSFSTGWFKERKFKGEIERKLYTTGHVLEWLVFSLPESELSDPRIGKTVDYILNLMLSAPNYDLAVGPRGHALHALRMYEEKVFGKSDYTRFMNNKRLVNNNPQNGGGNSSSSQSGELRLFPAGFRRGKMNRR